MVLTLMNPIGKKEKGRGGWKTKLSVNSCCIRDQLATILFSEGCVGLGVDRI